MMLLQVHIICLEISEFVVYFIALMMRMMLTVMVDACTVQNSTESLDRALSLLKELGQPSMRAVAFTALLALTQVTQLQYGWSRINIFEDQ